MDNKNSFLSQMEISKGKIDYKAFFAKLHFRVEIQPKTFDPSVKQHPIMDIGGFKGISNLPTFATSKEVQQFVGSWKNKQIDFIQKYGADPCPRHYKVLFDMYNIDISHLETTLTKTQARTLLKTYISRRN
jgi:hypothetical protein